VDRQWQKKGDSVQRKIFVGFESGSDRSGVPARRLCAALALALAFAFVGPAKAIADPVGSAGAEAEPGSAPPASSAPVVVDSEEIFWLAGIQAYPAEQRAREVADRIRAIASDPGIDPASIHSVPATDSMQVLVGDDPLFRLVELDATLSGVPLSILADVVCARISRTIVSYRADRRPEVLGRHALEAALIAAGAGLLLWLTLRLRRWMDALLDRTVQARIRELEQQSRGVIGALQVESAIRTLLNLLASILAASIVYVSLNSILGLFVWTRGAARQLWDVLLGPLAIVLWSVLDYVPNLVFLAIVIVFSRFIISVTHLFFDRLETNQIRLGGFEAEWAQPTYRLVRLLILAFTVVVAYPYLPGSRSEALKGVSLLLGVMVSIGSSSVIGNIIAGYTMTYRRAFRPGDRIQIGDVIGDVIESKVLATRVRTPRNEEVIIPNSLILSSNVVNYSSLAASEGLILQATVGIGYEVPWRQVEAMLIIAAGRTPDVDLEPSPFVLQTKLGDFGVEYTLNVVARAAQRMLAIRSDLHRHIQDVFNEHEVAIMTPAYVADPSEPKIVPPDKWYAAPATRPGSESA
jgi:small-conductance mechanosensitive channel